MQWHDLEHAAVAYASGTTGAPVASNGRPRHSAAEKRFSVDLEIAAL
jgi:hypothetical protein